MTNEEKKEYLNEYKLACKKVVALQEQLESLREVEQSAKVQKLSDMPKVSSQSDLSDLMIRIEKLQEKIDTALAKCIEKKLEIEEALNCIEDGEEARILRYRYIRFMRWEEICGELNYSSAQIHRIHSKALNNFKMRVNESE